MKIHISLLIAVLVVISVITASPVYNKRDDTDITSAVDDTTVDGTADGTVDDTTVDGSDTAAADDSDSTTDDDSDSSTDDDSDSSTNDNANSTTIDDNASTYNTSDIQLLSDTAFCSFLPYAPGVDIATTENEGKPFCTNSTLGGYPFPEGFILTSHYLTTESYTQITGTINPAAYNMSTTDEGGQYDNRDQGQHTCNGLKYFVNLVEPNGGTFCIRCCTSQADCNIGISQDGCVKVVPGDYS